MGATFPQAVVEIVHATDKTAGAIDSGTGLLRVISVGHAFREYNWLYQPALNTAENFRGMVISKNWRTVFQVTSDYRETFGNIALVAALAGNIVEARSQISTILGGKDSADIKAARLSSEISSIAIRTLTGVVPAGTHILATSLQGYCQMAGLAIGDRFSGPRQCVDSLRSIDAWVSTTYKNVTNGNNIYHFIDTRVNPWISQKLGF